jgi:hypothetical protein
VQARLEEAAQCLLVIIAPRPKAKGTFQFIDGVRESAQSWKELSRPQTAGLAMDPSSRSPTAPRLGRRSRRWLETRGQRCWVHKTANVLNKLPKSQQSKASVRSRDLDGRDQEG